MSFKTVLACAFLVVSISAQAIPPVPPTAIYNKIRTIAARNCKTLVGEIAVSDLKDTEKVKFVLQLNKEGSAGILTVLSGCEVQDNLEVTCK